MSELINPFTDWGFKRLFGREESKPVLIDLLNSILIDDRKIVDIRYDNKERTPIEADNRTVIYDIYSDNRHIIVEMQYGRQWYFRERTIFYATRSIEDREQLGDWNYQFDEVLLIGFMKYEDKHISDKFRTDVMLKDIETNEVFSNRLRLIYLQLPKAESMKEADCITDLDCWIYNLNNMETLKELAFKDKKPIFEELEKMAAKRFMTYDDNVAYQRALKRLYDYNAVMNCERAYAREEGHEQGLQEGREQGLQEGREQGLQEGREQGLQEGREQGLQEGRDQGIQEGREQAMQQGMQQEKLEIAGKMKQNGMPVDTIMLYTGLTQEQVETL